MTFSTLIFKNLLRRKTRSFLAILGISVGIATIVALGVISSGLKASAEDIFKTGKADFSIAEGDVADLAFSIVEEKDVREIERIEGIKSAGGILLGIYPVSGNPYFILTGVRADDLKLAGIEVSVGKPFSERKGNEIVLGKLASEHLEKYVGDKITLGGKRFKITGIYETGTAWWDGGAYVPLETLQRMEKKEEKLTMVYVELERGADADSVTQYIEKEYPELVTIRSLSDLSQVDQGIQIIDAATWMISLLAVIVGGIGVMNTMIMSVYERTREIGVLRALGWKRWRILAMILSESFIVGLLGAVAGAVIGVVAVNLIMLFPVMQAFMGVVYSSDVFIKALAVALLVGLFGGFYPAYRASRLSPMEALRYE